MGNLRLFYFVIILILLAGFVAGVRSILSEDELVFSFDGKGSKKGVITFETDTEPILISVERSLNIKDYLKFEPISDLRVSEKEPLVLKLDVINPGKELKGYLTINMLYEKLPEKVNYYGDDTIRIPVILTKGDRESLTKMDIELTEKLAEGEEAIPLGVGVILPVILIIILLVIFKRKWQKT
ncbi:MAG: hypothetical protein ABIB47_02065 [Candidatus Woesearchaeota archaeon]